MNAIPNPLMTCICLAYIHDRIRALLHALARSANEDSSGRFYDYDNRVVIGVIRHQRPGTDVSKRLCLYRELPSRRLPTNPHANVFAPSCSAQPAFMILLVVYYYGYRYYKPDVGRWISEDPLMDPGNLVVMALRNYVLGLLKDQMAQQQRVALNKSLSDEEQTDALYRMLEIDQLMWAVIGNQPTVWLDLAGENWFLFCANSPVISIDLMGLTEFSIWEAFKDFIRRFLTHPSVIPTEILDPDATRDFITITDAIKERDRIFDEEFRCRRY